MKMFLLMTLLLSSLSAQETAFAFKEKPGHFVYFVKGEEAGKSLQQTAGKKEVTYYKNGVISDRSRFVTNDRIQIAFSATPDITQFEQEFSLKRIAILKKNLMIFENHSDFDDVELCSKLWEEPGIDYARPLFKNKKRVQ